MLTMIVVAGCFYMQLIYWESQISSFQGFGPSSRVSETGENLILPSTGWTQKPATVNNHFAENPLQTNHHIDWDSAKCLINCKDYNQRFTLERTNVAEQFGYTLQTN